MSTGHQRPDRLVGVMGWPVEHSLSPQMHNAAFAALGLNWCYVPLAVAPERLPRGGRRALARWALSAATSPCRTSWRSGANGRASPKRRGPSAR